MKMGMGLGLRIVIPCEVCGGYIHEHRSHCPVLGIEKLGQTRKILGCPVCYERAVELNTGDYFECRKCKAVFSTGIATPEDPDTLPRYTILDLDANAALTVVKLSTPGTGEFVYDRNLAVYVEEKKRLLREQRKKGRK